LFVHREKRQKIEDIKKNIRDAIIVSIFLVSLSRWRRKRVLFVCSQTITGAMSTLSPPVSLEHNSNQGSVDYIQDVASQHDFDYPQVSFFLLSLCIAALEFGTRREQRKSTTL
jgi:guanine nucleotide-binding protein G(s) subunit alpha